MRSTKTEQRVTTIALMVLEQHLGIDFIAMARSRSSKTIGADVELGCFILARKQHAGAVRMTELLKIPGFGIKTAVSRYLWEMKQKEGATPG